MSSTTPTIKRHYHTVYPCLIQKKDELLQTLLEKNSSKKIIVITTKGAAEIQQRINKEDLTIMDDETLSASDMKADLIISYDLPTEPSIYLQRLSHTSTEAIILADVSENELLYAIEMLQGRTIRQEVLQEFIAQEKAKDQEPKTPYEKKEPVKKFEKKEYKKPGKWDAKKRPESKYIGKDENGKPMFSGKTNDRNHAYNGKPKNGDAARKPRKINVKSIKPKEESK